MLFCFPWFIIVNVFPLAPGWWKTSCHLLRSQMRTVKHLMMLYGTCLPALNASLICVEYKSCFQLYFTYLIHSSSHMAVLFGIQTWKIMYFPFNFKLVASIMSLLKWFLTIFSYTPFSFLLYLLIRPNILSWLSKLTLICMNSILISFPLLLGYCTWDSIWLLILSFSYMGPS